MSKTKISDYSSTPANNTDIGGINIAEGMLPSDVNNAIREQMAQLKNFQSGASGESVTFATVRIVTSINDTNGNEVFGITATGSAVNELTVANAATGNNPTISATGSDTNIGITLTPKGTGGVVFPAGAVGTPSITTAGDTNTGIYFPAADQVAIATNGAERVEFGNSETVFNDGGANVDFRVEGDTDANLLFVDASAEAVGIGTSSPATILNASRDSGLSTGTGTTIALRLSDTGQDGGAGTWNTTQQFTAIQFYSADASGAGAAVRASVGATMESGNGATSALTFFTNASGTNTERMRLDSSGNLGLGVTPTASSNYAIFDIKGRATGQSAILSFFDGAGTNTGAIQSDTNYGVLLGAGGARPIAFFTNSTERMRIDSAGNVLIGGTASPASAVGTLAIFNGTAPTGSVTNGCVLYTEDVSSSSELKVRDEAGNVTTLSPHNFSMIPEGPSEDMAWAYYSEKGGKRINVDMLKLARMVEKLTGEKLVYTD